MPIVASCLKLYLLELPDSIVSSGLYEIIKTIYTSPATASDDATQTRISVLQNTLGQLRLANIATLDALCTHFARLVDLTSASDEYVTQLTQALAPCILRSRTESALLFEEKYNVRFLRDLLANKDAIFGELKRSAALQHSASVARAQSTVGTHAHQPQPTVPTIAGDPESAREAPSDGNRARAISTDESNRRAHMEERNRAIASRSRAPSPAPGAREHHPENGTANNEHNGGDPGGPSHGHRGRHSASLRRPEHGHRRDSSRGPETRFPVAVASAPGVHRGSAGASNGPDSPKVSSPRSTVRNVRDSLEVPGSPPDGSGGNVAISGMSATSGPVHAPASEPAPPAVPPKDEVAHEGAPNGRVRTGTESESPRDSVVSTNTAEVGKRDSLNRRVGVARKGTGESLKRESMGSLGRRSLEGGTSKRGVELVDRAMDD